MVSWIIRLGEISEFFVILNVIQDLYLGVAQVFFLIIQNERVDSRMIKKLKKNLGALTSTEVGDGSIVRRFTLLKRGSAHFEFGLEPNQKDDREDDSANRQRAAQRVQQVS